MNDWHVVWCHTCHDWLDADRKTLGQAQRLRALHSYTHTTHEISIYEEVD